MNKKRDELWSEAMRLQNVASIDVGRLVVCDRCDKDFTDLNDLGGMIVGSYGYGPCCMQKSLDGLKKYGEMHLITERCPQGKSFADFIREYRSRIPGGNEISITSHKKPSSMSKPTDHDL